jgi:hypothetical protein
MNQLKPLHQHDHFHQQHQQIYYADLIRANLTAYQEGRLSKGRKSQAYEGNRSLRIKKKVTKSTPLTHSAMESTASKNTCLESRLIPTLSFIRSDYRLSYKASL